MKELRGRVRALASSAALLLLLTGTGLPAATAAAIPEPAPSAAATHRQFTTAAVPEITGTAHTGQSLSADAGTWEPAPASLTYQWDRDGAPIPAATGPEYQAGAADAGAVLRVSVSGSRPGYDTLTRTSEPTDIVTTSGPAASVEPTVPSGPAGTPEPSAPATPPGTPSAGPSAPSADETAPGTAAPGTAAPGEPAPAVTETAPADTPAPDPAPEAVQDPTSEPTQSVAPAAPAPAYDAQFRALADRHGLSNPGPLTCGLAGGGCQQDFTGASIYRTPAGDYRVIGNPIRAAYWAEAGQGGPLGYPSSDQRCSLPGGACVQDFAGGSIYLTPATGTHAVRGAVNTAWLAAGGPSGTLGYPVTGQRCGLAGGGCQQDFTGGSIYLTPSGAAFTIAGPVRALYWAGGGHGGALGYPVTGQRCGLIGGGCQQDFENGSIYLTPAGTVHPVNGPFRAAYWGKAGQGGALGYPAGNRVCGLVGGGCQQDFTGGTLYSTPAGGVFSVQGGIRASYWNAAGHAGTLGYPTGDHVCGLPGSGCQQNFERGTVSLTGNSAAVASTNPYSARWLELGGVFGPLGYPVAGQSCGLTGGGCQQDFTGGTLYSTPDGGLFSVQGAVRTAYWAAGGHAGSLGYPTGDQLCGLPGGGCRQNFRGGTVSTADGVPPLVDINPWTLPLPAKSYNYSSQFGARCIPVIGGSTFHLGQDLAAPANTPIFATAAGTVVKTKNGTADVSGVIAIEHNIGGAKITSAYYHMWNATTHVTVGTKVAPGQQIGLVGTSGPSTANHLHYEIWEGGWYTGTALNSGDYLSGKGVDLKANAKVVWNFPTPAVCTYYSAAVLSLRSEPTVSSILLATLPSGTMMTSVPGTIVNGYVPVTVNGQSGWVLAGGVSVRS